MQFKTKSLISIPLDIFGFFENLGKEENVKARIHVPDILQICIVLNFSTFFLEISHECEQLYKTVNYGQNLCTNSAFSISMPESKDFDVITYIQLKWRHSE